MPAKLLSEGGLAGSVILAAAESPRRHEGNSNQVERYNLRLNFREPHLSRLHGENMKEGVFGPCPAAPPAPPARESKYNTNDKNEDESEHPCRNCFFNPKPQILNPLESLNPQTLNL